jgi:hypothetical protein
MSSGLPKAASASERAPRSSSGKSFIDDASRMPRPPPPAAALIITGKPMRAASAAKRASPWSSPW